jgi:hypothetical protein
MRIPSLRCLPLHLPSDSEGLRTCSSLPIPTWTLPTFGNLGG